MQAPGTLWRRSAPLLIIAAVYTVHFHFEGLAHYCFSRRYGYVELALAIPPISIARGDGLLSLSRALLGCGLATYAWLSVFALRRSVLAVMLPLVFGVTALATYYVNTTGVPISADLMEAVFETNTGEFGETVNLRLFASISFALVVSVVLLRLLWKELAPPTHPARRFVTAGRWLRAAAGAAATAYILVTPIDQPLAIYPHNLLRAMATYVPKRLEMNRQLALRRDIGPGAVLDPTMPNDLVVVLVIGESARADHFEINGYPRPTTPQLARLANLVSFPHASACALFTRTSVPCLMTRATAATWSVTLEETSLISVFNHVGFTTAWLSSNGVYHEWNNAVSAVAKEAQLREFNGSIDRPGLVLHDLDLLPSFDRVLAEHSGRLLVVLHTMGSHWHYERRYPRDWRRFVPTCDESSISQCDHIALINSYDNTIVYTDEVLARVVDRLQQRYALFLYVADHGQLLGEDGRFMHGQDRPEVRHVPMVWWASERFLTDHADRFARLTSHRDEPVSHDHVFHSLLDCAGIRSPVIDPALSLCASASTNRHAGVDLTQPGM